MDATVLARRTEQESNRILLCFALLAWLAALLKVFHAFGSCARSGGLMT